MTDKFAVVKKVYSKHYYALLISVIVLTFVAPLVNHSFWSHMAVGLLLLASLMTAAIAVRSEEKIDKKSIAFSLGVALIWMLAFCADTVPFKTAPFQLFALAVILVFFIHIMEIMIRDILTGDVNSNRICGGACVYILIGFCFALMHMMIAIQNPAAYRDNMTAYDASNSPHERYPLLIYFSFCTLSTVGYGDVLPISRLARACACLEAVSGQLYLTILVARLVGMHTAVKAEPRRLEAERNIDKAIDRGSEST